MALVAAVGQAKMTHAREAGLQAAYQALNGLGNATPSLCLLIIPHRYAPGRVIEGVSSVLTNIPTLGLSVSASLSQMGIHRHSVIAALLGGDDIHAQTHLFSAFRDNATATASLILQLAAFEQRPANGILVFGGGRSDKLEEFCNNLPAGLPLLGGLASGDPAGVNTFEIAGTQFSNDGLAAGILRGNFKIGVGYGHGWVPTDGYFNITATEDFLIKQIDGMPILEKYSQLFGYSPQEWKSSPLNTLCRMYPPAIKQEGMQGLRIMAPLAIEEDGSLRMNILPAQGSTACIMVGSPDMCRQSIHKSIKQALQQLGGSKPVFAFILMDEAWHSLLQTQPDMVIQTIQEMIGKEIPIAGGYTLGQILPPEQPSSQCSFANQHIISTLFAEAN